MDFFEAQERAKRRTGLLVLLFLGAVATIIVVVYLAVVVSVGTFEGTAPGFDPGLFAVVALGTGTLVGLGSLFRTSQLRSGGPAVASLLGGRLVDPGTTDPGERQLVNVVEEMALASGMPVPAIFVLPGEEGINAFAAGYTIHDAAVAVTKGALERLSREELEGVVAHEFSHILNGDMRLNVRLIGLLFGILLLAIVGRGLLRGGMYSRAGMTGRRRGGGGGGQIAVVGIALVAVGYIGVLFGKLIKAAVSRQREFLADAAAVQFTRNPRGLAGALARIREDVHGSRIQDHHAEELSHLFFAGGVGSAFSRLTATHPPLDERIRRIDPSLIDPSSDGEIQPTAPEPEETVGSVGASRAFARGTPFPAAPPDTPVNAGLASGLLLASVGNPHANHVGHTRRMLGTIPPALREATHDVFGARALILGMLGGEDEASAEARREGIRRLALERPEVEERVVALASLAEGVAPELRLPLVDLALPTIHLLQPEEATAFRQAVRQVVNADGRVRTFDFALVHILWRHLPDSPPRRGDGGRTTSPARLGREIEAVLSALARFGHDDEEGAESAFRAGAARMPGDVDGLRLRPAASLGFGQVDAALARLERASLDVRRRILEGAIATALADGEVRIAEVELLRAIAESLELPLPPLVPAPEA